MKLRAVVVLFLVTSIALALSACTRQAGPDTQNENSTQEEQSEQKREIQLPIETHTEPNPSATEQNSDSSQQEKKGQNPNINENPSSTKLPSLSDDIPLKDTEKYQEAQEYINFLDALLLSEWKNPQNIPPMDFVMWYGYQVKNLGTAEKYFIDNRDGLFFPFEEFETEIRKYFDVPIEHLRSDSSIYLKDEQLYRTPAALMPLAEREYDITDIKKNGSVIHTEFTLTYVMEPRVSKEMVLTMEEVDGGIHFVSLSSQT